MSDNILDLSHIEYLHPALGTEAVGRAKVEVEAQGDAIVTTRTTIVLETLKETTALPLPEPGAERPARGAK
jgi:vanillate O-demethylase monooxygenase subunit